MSQMNLLTDRSLALGPRGSTHFVIAEIRATQQTTRSERPGLDLGISLDRSGSMGGNKIDLAREGVATSIRMLRETDRFSLVTFSTQVDVPVPSMFATDDNKLIALSTLRRITATGGTDLFTGYLKSALQVSRDMRENRLSRVLLLTDGQANHGIVDEDEIVGHVEQLRLRGLITSTIGLGADFNESLLKRMAASGGGNSYFVEHSEQLPDVLSGEVGDTLEVTDRDVVLEVRVPAGMHVEPMDTSRLTVVPGGLRIQLGDLVSGQTVRVVFEVRVPAQGVEPSTTLEFVLERAGEDATEVKTGLEFVYAAQVDYMRQPVDHEVLQHAYPTYSARARRLAAELNARHEYSAARRTMQEAYERLSALAGDDPAAYEHLDALRNDTDRHGYRMDPMESKRRGYEADHWLRDRDHRGRPRRGA